MYLTALLLSAAASLTTALPTAPDLLTIAPGVNMHTPTTFGMNFCENPYFGGPCKWVRTDDKGCHTMWDDTNDFLHASFWPDQGLVCTVYQDTECSTNYKNQWTLKDLTYPGVDDVSTDVRLKAVGMKKVRSFKCKKQ